MSVVALTRKSIAVTVAACATVWVAVRVALARVPEAGMLLGLLHAAVRRPRLIFYKACLKAPYTPLRKHGGVAKLTTVRINETDLSVVVRGQAGARPILFLHGGPGMTEIPFFLPKQGPLEAWYLCVHYDQRGSGTSGYHVDKLTVGMHVEDCIAILEWIKSTLSEKPAIVVGGSWGSMLGMIVAMRRPDLISHLVLRGAFVSGAQNEKESNRYVLGKMRELGFEQRRYSLDGFDRRAVAFVESLTKKSSTDPLFADNLLEQRQLLASLGGSEFFESGDVPVPKWTLVKEKTMAIALAPEVGLKTMLSFKRSMKKSLNDMWPEMELWDATTVQLQMPVTVCHGRHDYNTPWRFVDNFMAHLQSPDKELVWFHQSAHAPDKEETCKFISTMLRRIPGP